VKCLNWHSTGYAITFPIRDEDMAGFDKKGLTERPIVRNADKSQPAIRDKTPHPL
jgi:hypothetical protein